MEGLPVRPPRRVLVLRAAKQSSALAELLTAAGYEPIEVPAIELTAPATFAPLDAALAALSSFDWLLFTSANAVRVFAERRQSASLPGSLRIAAIGPSTAEAVNRAGFRVDLVPGRAMAESFAEALLPHALNSDGRPARFLLIRAESARDHLPETLRAAGAEVTIAPAYRTVVAESSIPKVREFFADESRWPDAIAFTSASTVHNLIALLESAGTALPQAIRRISIGPITSQAMLEQGIPAHGEAYEANLRALVEAISTALDAVDE